MVSLVVVAARGKDRLELAVLRDKYTAGFLRGLEGSRWAFATASEAAPPAAEMLSLAICVTASALLPRGHVPPYQLLGG